MDHYKMIAAFDVDGVTVDIDGMLRERLADQGVQVQPLEAAMQFEIQDVAGIPIDGRTVDKALQHIFRQWDKIPFYPDAREYFGKTYDRYKVVFTFVTARKADYAHYTIRLLDRLNVPYNISFKRGSKIPYLSGFKYLVEDRRRNALDWVRSDPSRLGIIIQRPGINYNHVRRARITTLRSMKTLLALEEFFIKEAY